MSTKILKQIIQEADNGKIAIGHFNISNIEGLWGIFNGARELNVPVIIGASEGERKFFGTKQIVAVVKSLREEFDYPIFCNADHCHSYESFKEAVDTGFDAVIYDGAKLSLDENIKETKKCVEYAKSVNPEIVVEGETGYIGDSSKLLDSIPDGVAMNEAMTKPEDAERFVQETGVDLFSPAVGNIHGMLKNMNNPKLDIERIKAIREKAGVPLVLHGGSGIADEDFVNAIKSGIAIVHINTEIRLAYKKSAKESFANCGEEIAPYKIMEKSVLAIKDVVKKRLELFSK